jgi:hypothetical protein
MYRLVNTFIFFFPDLKWFEAGSIGELGLNTTGTGKCSGAILAPELAKTCSGVSKPIMGPEDILA